MCKLKRDISPTLPLSTALRPMGKSRANQTNLSKLGNGSKSDTGAAKGIKRPENFIYSSYNNRKIESWLFSRRADLNKSATAGASTHAGVITHPRTTGTRVLLASFWYAECKA